MQDQRGSRACSSEDSRPAATQAGKVRGRHTTRTPSDPGCARARSRSAQVPWRSPCRAIAGVVS
eukprot:3912884-Pleurochrysis_carterae.AAC.1